MGSQDMMQFIPFLQGKYLHYSEYFALVGWLAIGAISLLFAILSRITRMSSSRKNKKNDVLLRLDESLTLSEQVCESLSVIFRAINVITLQYLFIPLSMFRVAPVWISILWGTGVGFFGTRKLTRRLKIRRSFTPLLALLVVNAVTTPILLNKSCFCFYSSIANIIPFKDTIGLDTQVSRYIWGRHWCQDPTKPCHVYTTLPEDGTTNMQAKFYIYRFINVHTSLDHFQIGIDFDQDVNYEYEVLHYNDIEQFGQRYHHIFSVHNLIPDTLYQFTLSLSERPYNQLYTFRTQPSSASPERPLQIVNGGDAGNSHAAMRIWKQIQNYDPDVISIGGDVSYDNNIIDCYWTHDYLLESYETTMLKIGRLVPLVLSAGNHDYGLNPYSHRPVHWIKGKGSPLIMSYYPQEQNTMTRSSYHAHFFGGILFLALDSGYVTDYIKQAQYIDDLLTTYPNVSAKLATYHIPLYSTCFYEQKDMTFFEHGLDYWVTRFDKYHFETVYENHVHTFKRTKLLRNSTEDENGTLYLGDGNWGADYEHCNINNGSHLVKFGVINSFWLTTFNGTALHHQAVDDTGAIFDDVSVPV